MIIWRQSRKVKTGLVQPILMAFAALAVITAGVMLWRSFVFRDCLMTLMDTYDACRQSAYWH